MQRLRTLIADSNEQSRARLRELVERRADLSLLAECVDGFQAAVSIGRLRPDLAILDLELAGMNAFAVFGQIGEFRPQMVFTSSTAEGAVQAFELGALDFIVKPFADHRLLTSIDRARRAMAHVGAFPAEELRNLLQEVRGGCTEQIAVRSQRAIVLLPLAEITWVEAQNTAVRIHAGRKSHVMRTSMTDIEGRLPSDRFMRVHREAIVNLRRVQELLPWQYGDFRIVLCDGTIVPLGRRYRKDLTARLSIERLRVDA